MKRILSLCIALALLACLAMPVFAADPLDVIKITGLSEPEPGRYPSFGANLRQSDVAKIANIAWMDLSTDTYMSGTDAFRYSTEEVEIGYRLEITVMITDPSVVWSGNSIIATVNGAQAEAWRVDDVYAKLERDFYMPMMPEHTCSGGYATCVEPAKCSVCGKAYGKPNPENHDIFAYPKADGDSKLYTHHDVKCDLCKKFIREETHEFGEPDHNGAWPCIHCWYRLPKGQGANKPTNPTTPTEPADHTHKGGIATCKNGPTCTECGKEYGKPDESKHELVAVKKANTDEKYGTHHDLQCQVCKKIVKDEAHTLGPENGQGVKPCIVCWYVPEVEVAPHECTGGQATCCEKAVCTICGKEYGEFDENAHTYLETWGMTDEKGHAKNCIACGETAPYEDHVPSQDDPQICGVCGYPIEKTAGKPMSKRAVIAIAAGGTVAAGGAATGLVFVFRRFRLPK